MEWGNRDKKIQQIASLSNLQAAVELQKLTSSNQGDLRVNGLHLPSLTKKHITKIPLVWEIERTETQLMPFVPAKPKDT